MRARPLWTFAALAAALAAAPASAQPFRDPAFNALYADNRVAEMDRLAQQRLARRADDEQAVLAAALVALAGHDTTRHAATLQQAEACLRTSPRAAACHYALGALLALQSVDDGALQVVANLGRVKQALQAAVALEPAWYLGRAALVEFYAQAPRLAGGGLKRAREVARAAPVPAQQRVLEARIAVIEDRFDEALRGLADQRPGSDATPDAALDADLRQWWVAAGVGLMGQRRMAEARAAFERLQREQPEQAAGTYGLARWHFDNNAPAEAVAAFERAARLKGAERLSIDYRLGLALQALGRHDAARAAYRRFIQANRGARRALQDARERLARLGG